MRALKDGWRESGLGLIALILTNRAVDVKDSHDVRYAPISVRVVGPLCPTIIESAMKGGIQTIDSRSSPASSIQSHDTGRAELFKLDDGQGPGFLPNSPIFQACPRLARLPDRVAPVRATTFRSGEGCAVYGQ
jgi:hypothetical protein